MRSAGGGASSVLPQSLAEQDALHWRDAKFRHFRDEMDSALAQFVYAQEWADLIRYLQRMQRILTKYAQLPVIPDKIAVAKRLFQCLNSSLPSGVHLTTLQTYELIFSRIGPRCLAVSQIRALLHGGGGVLRAGPRHMECFLPPVGKASLVLEKIIGGKKDRSGEFRP